MKRIKPIYQLFTKGIYVAFLLFALCISCTKDDTDMPKPQENTEKEIEDDAEYDGEITFRQDILTVAQFIKGNYGNDYVIVEGYIVGACRSHIAYAEWEPPFSYDNAILLADDRGETGKDKVVAIQLYNNELKFAFSLRLNPEHYQRKVRFCAMKQKYLGISGMKHHIWAYEWIEE